MKVNLNVNQSSANFGMAIKIQPSEDKKVASYLSRKLVTVKDAIELNKYYESQKNIPHDIYLSTTSFSRDVNERFQAAIGGYTFIKKNPLSAIKKAVSVANSYNNEAQTFEAKTSGLYGVINKIINNK